MGVLVPPEVDLSLQQLLLDGVALLPDLRLHLRVGVVHWTVVVADDWKKLKRLHLIINHPWHSSFRTLNWETREKGHQKR